MKVLIVGSGGREHALAWKASRSDLTSEIYVAPGNGGTALERDITNVEISAEDIDGLASFALKNKIDLTIVGPEVPLVLGITDEFKKKGLRCFGPSKDAARLEGSKDFMKDFLSRNNIPTALYKSFTDINLAKDYVKNHSIPVVIKADGLAAGKGVIIANSTEEAFEAIEQCMEDKEFGEAGSKVVIEEFLEGEEASFIVLTDGNVILPLASSQDHKARDDGDKGPNTGGMGAYSPAPIITNRIHERIMQQIILPTVEGIHSEGMAYRGFLYVGLMIDEDGSPGVIEFNVRFGDPETQVTLPLISSDLGQLLLACAEGRVKEEECVFHELSAATVVLASEGYPAASSTGRKISGSEIRIEEGLTSAYVHYAGTVIDGEGRLVSSGGRVLSVTGLAPTLGDAVAAAYELIECIELEGSHYRSDIAYRAL